MLPKSQFYSEKFYHVEFNRWKNNHFMRSAPNFLNLWRDNLKPLSLCFYTFHFFQGFRTLAQSFSNACLFQRVFHLLWVTFNESSFLWVTNFRTKNSHIFPPSGFFTTTANRRKRLKKNEILKFLVPPSNSSEPLKLHACMHEEFHASRD